MAKNGTIAYVEAFPVCDVHGIHDAAYDARVRIHGRHVWAFVCEEAFRTGGGELGTGKGQRLQLRRGNVEPDLTPTPSWSVVIYDAETEDPITDTERVRKVLAEAGLQPAFEAVDAERGHWMVALPADTERLLWNAMDKGGGFSIVLAGDGAYVEVSGEAR